VSQESEEHFPDLIKYHLPRPLLDHFPLLLDSPGMFRGSRSLKFENMWFKAEGFVDMVKQWWDSSVHWTILVNNSSSHQFIVNIYVNLSF
jgi:hypothetical protein